ncbi:MAG TPA: hypothetical protein VII47_08685 [Actinomycetota bacterium]|jgi:hypothetical protein
MGTNPLVLIGLACIIGAIVGGGLKLMGIEIPLFTSVRRQILLAGLGVALVAGVGIARLNKGASDGAAGETGPSVAPPSASATATPQCYGRVFQGIAQDRLVSLEEGTDGSGVVRPEQPKDQPVGLVLTDGGTPIGALTFRFFPAGVGTFKIDRIVDARCREVTQFLNASRPGGARNALQNWDTLRVQLGDHSYTARFGSGSDISVSFRREA